MELEVVLTCEHARPGIPPKVESTLGFDNTLLNSHQGFDDMAFDFAKALESETDGTLFHYPYSRLFIDANRDVASPQFYGAYAEQLQATDMAYLLDAYWNYRRSIFDHVEASLNSGKRVVAISVHSFVAIYKGQPRQTELGLLFRPSIQKELQLAEHIRSTLGRLDPRLAIHFNRPYQGHTDCFLNDLSDHYANNDNYTGLFLELSQKIQLKDWLVKAPRLAQSFLQYKI